MGCFSRGGVRTRTRVSQCYALNLFIWGFCSSCKYLAVHQRVKKREMKFLSIKDNHFFLRISHSFATRHCVKLYEWIIKAVFCALNCPFFIASSTTTTYQLYATINAFKLSVQEGKNDKRSRLKCLLTTAGGFNAFYNVFFLSIWEWDKQGYQQHNSLGFFMENYAKAFYNISCWILNYVLIHAPLWWKWDCERHRRSSLTSFTIFHKNKKFHLSIMFKNMLLIETCLHT